MTATLKDHNARLAAIDPRRSFCVTAPAGSGKTELLTQRYLALLAHCRMPEEILAITFTRKAVAEMRHRILHALRSAREAGAEADAMLAAHLQQTRALARAALAQDAAQSWGLLDNPSRLRVYTFDAYSMQLATQMPQASGFGGQPGLLEDATELYEEAAERVVRRLEERSALGNSVATVLTHLDCRVDQLQALLASMLSRRDRWQAWFSEVGREDEAQITEILQANLADYIVELLRGIRQQLLPFESTLCELADFGGSQLLANGPIGEKGSACISQLAGMKALPEEHREKLLVWKSLARLLLTDEGCWRAKPNKKQGFPPKTAKPRLTGGDLKECIDSLRSAQPLLLAKLQELQEVPLMHYREENWEVFNALVLLLRYALGELELCFQSHQAIDFPASSLQSLQALGSFEQASDLALRLDYQLNHILVDEFQDTSLTQNQLLTSLCREWSQDAAEGKRSLFIVGDGMQSIYAFRNARVGLFMRARLAGLAGVELNELQLETNFRSRRPLISFVNDSFSRIFPATDDLRMGAARHVGAVPPPSTLEDDSEIRCFVYDEKSKENIEALHIAETVKRLCERFGEQHSVAILARNRNHLRHIIPVLRDKGVPWQGQRLEKLLDQSCVTDAISLTRAWLNGGDKIAWLALLRSPLCGLTLVDLQRLAADTAHLPTALRRHSASGFACLENADSMQRLQAFWLQWQSASLQAQRKTLAHELIGLWRALSGPGIYNSSAEQGYIDAYFNIVERYAPDWQDIERALGQEFVSSTGSGVNILTMHQSKGLEFDSVILPELNELSRADDSELINWFDPVDEDGRSPLILGIKPRDAARGKTKAQTIYSYVRYLQKQQSAHETSRLLYVACTRARQNLYLYGAVKINDKGDHQASASSLLGHLWPAIETQVEFLSAPAASPNDPVLLERVSMDGRLIRPRETKQILADVKAPLAVTQVTWSAADDSAYFHRAIGSVVHENLENWAASGKHDWLSDPSALAARWRAQLLAQGLRVELDAAADWVQQALHAATTDKDNAWLFESVEEAEAELALSGRTKEKIYHQRLDRCVRAADGQRWVIDYKTVLKDADALDWKAEAQSHAAQLHSYRESAATLFEEPIKIAVYFVLQQRLIALS